MDTLTTASIPHTATPLQIDRLDRWFIFHRLQELAIPCWCQADGSLWVDVQHAVDAVLVWSVVQQMVISRSQLADWLERCWRS